MSSRTQQIALIVIYNHPYERNIPIIEAIYRKRFSNIYHLVPFYQGNRTNVIPVYAPFRLFHNYLPQALPCFFNDKYDHYFFVADDLLLNPRLNENNLVEYLQLDDDTCFAPRIADFTQKPIWTSIDAEVVLFHRRQFFMDITAELPSMQEAKDAFQRFGYATRCLPVITELFNCRFGHRIPRWDGIRARLLRRLFLAKHLRYPLLEYPLVWGYADIFTINAKIIKQFCHLCGVFATADLHVEIAVPTAFVLCAKKPALRDLDLKLMEPYCCFMRMGSTDKPQLTTVSQFIDKQENDLKLLFDSFPEKALFIHPVKLSKFDTSGFL